ncbi:dynein heavy chain, partial [Coemansia sp. RSA 2524]
QCGMVAEANLARVVSEETTPAMPIALCSVPGHDAAYRVDALAREQQRTVHAVAMGSIEGLALADQAIALAAKTGSWVLLKNVHLAASWLGQLEKRLQTLRAPDGFRLFLTMEINPAVPPSLLRRARTLVFEPAPGIRANMLESLTSIPASTGPAELPRLRFMLAWLHSVVIERLRYAPLGWTTPYEFSDADFACALATVDCWVVRAAHGRANIDPARIPWTAIRTLLSECIYGGRIDSDFDHRVLRVFIDRWFCADAYNADFALVNDDCVVRGPDGTSHEEFVAWCHELPEHEPPVWLGLPPNAETLVLVQKGQEFVADVRRLRSLMDDDDDDDVEAGAQTSGVPAYMRHIDTVATAFSQQLPQALPLLSLPSSSSSLVQTPLFRVIERETRVAHKLLTLVHRDLHALRRVCRGETKQTNHVRNLLRDFNANVVPRAWLQYTVPRGCSLSRWVTDFAMRVDHIRELSACVESATAQTVVERVQSVRVWLGGLLFPEAF